MNLLYQNRPLFISGFQHQLGSRWRDLEQLKEEGSLAGEIEPLREIGYCQNYSLEEGETFLRLVAEPLSLVLARVKSPSALIFQHCNAESIVVPRESNDTIGATRNRYFPAAVLRELQVDHLPYFCSFASGCAGFLSLLIAAGGVLAGPDSAPVICAMGDSRPPETPFDLVRERILGSDHGSAFVVSQETAGYRLLGIGFYSTTRLLVPLVEIVKRTVEMIQGLAKELSLDLSQSEVVLHYPNIFPQTWRMVTRYLRLPRVEEVIDEMPQRAHCGASDSIISLAKLHRGQAGRIHIVANYGVGLHLGVCILREVTPG